MTLPKKAKRVAIHTQPKIDTTKNVNEDELSQKRDAEEQRQLYPLRINKQTVIYVPKNKQTEDYANRYRRIHGLSDGFNLQVDYDKQKWEEQIIEMYKRGMNELDIYVVTGAPKGVIKNTIKELELKQATEKEVTSAPLRDATKHNAISQEKINIIIVLHNQGYKNSEIKAKTGVSNTVISKYIKIYTESKQPKQ